jgi:hypothetical protein
MVKRGLFFFVFASLIGSYAYAQSYIILARTDDGHWRYYNIKGEVLIDKKFSAYCQFSEDGVAVVDEELYTLINRKGEVINTEIDVKLFDNHRYINKWFEEGLLITRHRTKFGCIDTLGRIAIPYQYYDLTTFNDGYAIGRIKRDYFVVNKKGDQIHIDDSTIVGARAFHEGLAMFTVKNGKSGFINTEGKIAIPAQFNTAGNFSNGLAWARAENDLIGYINTEGKWVIQPSLDAAKEFDKESGLARVKCKMKTPYVDKETGANRVLDGWKWVYMDATGMIRTFANSDFGDFNEGLVISKKDGQYGFMNNKGEWVIQPKFDHVREFKHELTVAEKDGLWGIIDKQGNWVLQPRWEVVTGGVVKLR